MRLNIHAGHGKQDSKSCGAEGLIKESIEDRKVKDEVIRLLKSKGHTVFDCTIDYPSSKSDCINKIVSKCNSNSVDLDVSIHFNSGAEDEKGNGKTTGVEVLVYNTTTKAYKYAKRVCDKISKLGFSNRGVKIRTDLGVLKTKNPNMLVECCFVDDRDDINKYEYKAIAKAIVEGILNENIIDNNQGLSYKKYKNCVLYGNDIDKVAAEVIGWSKEDCIVKHIDNHIKWEGSNLFIIGGIAETKMKQLNNGENYSVIKGNDRYDTIKKCLEFIGK